MHFFLHIKLAWPGVTRKRAPLQVALLALGQALQVALPVVGHGRRPLFPPAGLQQQRSMV
jgi:hypothetical protein